MDGKKGDKYHNNSFKVNQSYVPLLRSMLCLNLTPKDEYCRDSKFVNTFCDNTTITILHSVRYLDRQIEQAWNNQNVEIIPAPPASESFLCVALYLILSIINALRLQCRFVIYCLIFGAPSNALVGGHAVDTSGIPVRVGTRRYFVPPLIYLPTKHAVSHTSIRVAFM